MYAGFGIGDCRVFWATLLHDAVTQHRLLRAPTGTGRQQHSKGTHVVSNTQGDCIGSTLQPAHDATMQTHVMHARK